MLNGFTSLFFDPLQMVNKWRAIPVYVGNLVKYIHLNKGNQKFPLQYSSLYFTTYEKFMPGGILQGHYFFQDIWAAEKIFAARPGLHIDIASRIDGFIAHLLPFCKVEYVDIRKIDSPFQNLIFREGSLLQLPYPDNSVKSLSCLHVIEHIGLGRYGDSIDPAGFSKAAEELVRILAPGGVLYFGTPIGKEKLYFDAHRVFAIETILAMFQDLAMEEFSLINDKARGIIQNASFAEANDCRYGCGLFVFTKPGSTSEI